MGGKRRKKREAGVSPKLSGEEFTYQCRGQGFGPWSGKIPHALG